MRLHLWRRTIPVAPAASTAPAIRHKLHARHGHRCAAIDTPDARVATARALFREEHVLSFGIRSASRADDRRPR